MSWPANTAMQSMSTYQFFIDDPREQWMFTEVLHHPEVDFLHICDGIYQTLTQTDKHTETINTALRKILKLCYLLIWTHLSKNKHTHYCTDEKITNTYTSLFFLTLSDISDLQLVIWFHHLGEQFISKDKNNLMPTQRWITCVKVVYFGDRADKITRTWISLNTLKRHRFPHQCMSARMCLNFQKKEKKAGWGTPFYPAVLTIPKI